MTLGVRPELPRVRFENEWQLLACWRDMVGEPAYVGVVWPVYIAADESASMAAVMEDLNAGLRFLHNKLHQDPYLSSKVRLGVIGFSDTAICHLEASNPLDIDRMPQLAARGGSSVSAAFTDLRSRIEVDVARLESQGYGVYRPVVFVLTDGRASDEWQAAHGRLCDPAFMAHPNIMAFGFGDADPEALMEIATKPHWAWKAVTATSLADAIVEMTRDMTTS